MVRHFVFGCAMSLSLSVGACQAASEAPSSTDEGAGGHQGVGVLPCDVAPIVQSKCQICHSNPPIAGAPMPLVAASDFQAPAKTDPRQRVYSMVATRIHSTEKPMPQPPSPGLTPAELSTLDAWLGKGAPAGDAQCGADLGTGGRSAGGAANAGTTGVGGGGGNSSTGSGGSGPVGAGGGSSLVYPGAPADCDTAYEFRAHGTNGIADSSKYHIAATGGTNRYECYYFKAPWGTEAVQALNFIGTIDNPGVVHHWILWADDNNSAGLTDGNISPPNVDCGQTGSNGYRYYLAGWAPGAPPAAYPDTVGLQLPRTGNAMLTLEVHYLNQAATPVDDGTSVKMCLTHQLRPNSAVVHYLGADMTPSGKSLINVPPSGSSTTTGHCTPNTNQQAHILSIAPHMHISGVHSTVVLNRQGGGSETLHDGTFSFDNQANYPVNPEVLMNPGDSITTTCQYENTTSTTKMFGEKTQDEMCYGFLLAYPAGAVVNGKKGCFGNGSCLPGGGYRCLDEGP